MEEFEDLNDYKGFFIDFLKHENRGEVSRVVLCLLITKIEATEV